MLEMGLGAIYGPFESSCLFTFHAELCNSPVKVLFFFVRLFVSGDAQNSARFYFTEQPFKEYLWRLGFLQ